MGQPNAKTNPDDPEQLTAATRAALRALPSVETVLGEPALAGAIETIGRTAVTEAVRSALAELRAQALGGTLQEGPDAGAVARTVARALELSAETLVPVINASGVIIHTNLGRSVLCARARERIAEATDGYVSLEMDLETGARGSRMAHLRQLLREVTGAQAGAVYNNNACAVMLALSALAAGREVIVSRGQLVEIGGSFRLPDVMTQSGCRLVEVGCTNRTHLRDYADAITENTAAILRAHHSNYRIIGFTTEPSIEQLASLARERGLALIDDIGSGALLDLSQYGLLREPLVQESVAAGADAVCFSSDKLLGGPQGGVIVGTAQALARITRHPLARALRVDKLTVAALLGTLETWRDPQRALREIPTLRMLTEPIARVAARAEQLISALEGALPAPWSLESVRSDGARTGGGALPEVPIPTAIVRIAGGEGRAVEALARALRTGRPAVVPRIQERALALDMRTVFDGQVAALAEAVRRAAGCAGIAPGAPL